ncbi:MAG: hypothetical protein ACLUR5_01995 [Eubacterium ventriosum]
MRIIIERAYTVEEIKEALNLAGLEFVTVYDAFTRNEPNSESERIYVVARECLEKSSFEIKT